MLSTVDDNKNQVLTIQFAFAVYQEVRERVSNMNQAKRGRELLTFTVDIKQIGRELQT